MDIDIVLHEVMLNKMKATDKQKAKKDRVKNKMKIKKQKKLRDKKNKKFDSKVKACQARVKGTDYSCDKQGKRIKSKHRK